MVNILWLIRKTLINTFKSKKSLLLYFGLPLAGIFISTLVYGGASEDVLQMGIINNDSKQVITQDTIHFVEGLDNIKLKVIDPAQLNAEIASGRLDSALIFEQGFAQSVRAGVPAKLQIVSIKGAQVTAYVKSLLYGYIDNVAVMGKAAGDNEANFAKIYSGFKQTNFKLTSETITDNSKNKNMTSRTVGYLVMFMLFGSISLSELIIKEKENRTFFRLLASPITSRDYVIANVMVNIFVMMVQIIATLLFMKFLFQIDSGIPFWQLFLVLLLFALVAIGISLAIVAFAKSSASAGAMQTLFISPTCLIAGCFFPVEIMPATVRRIADFLPQHWILDTIDKLNQGSSLGSLYLNLLILVAFAAAFALIAIYKFGRNKDMRIFI